MNAQEGEVTVANVPPPAQLPPLHLGLQKPSRRPLLGRLMPHALPSPGMEATSFPCFWGGGGGHHLHCLKAQSQRRVTECPSLSLTQGVTRGPRLSLDLLLGQGHWGLIVSVGGYPGHVG